MEEDSGQEKEHEQSIRIIKVHDVFEKSQICFISADRDSGFREQPTAVDIMHLDFSRAFVQTYHDIIVDKMEKYALNKRTIR